MVILAIESSCDETSAAVMRDTSLIAHITASQAVHAAYGGVVPELASRAHQLHIVPVVYQALKQAEIKPQDLDAVAFTRGPGLMGALLVGAYFAKGLALSIGKPLIGVNHIRAHILAHFIESPKPTFPFLCLTVSGGHTQIVKVNSPMDMQIIGQTLDDAAGEAFDKTAKILGLPYPGGPLVDFHAKKGNPKAFDFAKGKVGGYDFSFSGLKTSILYTLRDKMSEDPDFLQRNLADICASAQRAIVETLMSQLIRAACDLGISQVALAGGVSANSALRAEFVRAGEKYGWQCFIPKFEYCTDNAAMVAMAAHFQYEAGDFCSMDAEVLPRMEL